MVFKHEIGLYSAIFSAPGRLGIRIRVVAFSAEGMNGFAKKSMTASVTSAPIINQVARKNSAVQPSGPGVLLRDNLNSVVLTKSLEIGAASKDC